MPPRVRITMKQRQDLECVKLNHLHKIVEELMRDTGTVVKKLKKSKKAHTPQHIQQEVDLYKLRRKRSYFGIPPDLGFFENDILS